MQDVHDSETFPIPFFRSPYNYNAFAVSDELANRFDAGVSMTVQAHAEDADLNVLMMRFGITGKMPENVRVPQYGDFTGVSDYRSAIEAVREAEARFNEMPANVRQFFANDPQNLLLFASDPANLPRMREMGLAKEVSNVGSGSVAPSVDSSPKGVGSAPAGQSQPVGSVAPGGSVPSGGRAA